MASRLHMRVAELLRDTKPDRWRELSNQCGLSFSWVRALAENRITSPSAIKLEMLLEGLTGEIICFHKAA